jgi:hypothetical protein
MSHVLRELSHGSGILMAYIKYVCWTILMKFGLGLMSAAIVAEGSRLMFPAMGVKLHKLAIPGFSMLKDYELTYRLDAAFLGAIGVMLFVFITWGYIIDRLIKLENTDVPYFSSVGAILVTVAGGALLLADAICLYSGIAELSWGGGISFTGILASMTYISIVVLSAFVSVQLRHKIDSLKDRYK